MPFVLYGGHSILQLHLGNADDFFMGKFITKKDPDDLAEFYQAHDLLEIIAVHPIIFEIFMNKVVAEEEDENREKLLGEEETRFRVASLGMEVSFEIIQEEEEIDGETVCTSFMRQERFVDYVPFLNEMEMPWGGPLKILLWDQTWTYGFKRQADGSVEVYHHGEKFYGPWPVRLIVFWHQYYVLWGCEKFINSETFGSGDLDKQQEELACIPLTVFKQFVSKVEEDTVKHLEELKRSGASAAQIAKDKAKIEKLKELQTRDTSTISVAKRQGGSGAMARSASVKVIASDTTTQEVLTAAMKDHGMKGALKETMRNPNLEFKPRVQAPKFMVAPPGAPVNPIK